MLSVTRLVDLDRPSRRRDSQPFFSTSSSFSRSARAGESGASLTDSLGGGETGASASFSTSDSTDWGGSLAGVPRERSRANQPFFSGSVSLTGTPRKQRASSSP